MLRVAPQENYPYPNVFFWNSGELRMGRRGARTDEDFLPPPRTILNIYMYYSTQKYYLHTTVQYCMAGTYYLHTTIQYSMEGRLGDNLFPRSFFLRLPNKDQTKTTKTVSLRSIFLFSLITNLYLQDD